MTPGETSPRAFRRPCAADRLGARARGHGYLKVPFARCADGIARHVAAVPPTAGPFICLDCEELLTLRRPRTKRAHFAHRRDSLCVGETALHRYAKELLQLSKTLSLPPLVLQNEGLSEIVFKSGTYEFDTVRHEQHLGTFQPDAIVTYKGVELAIEFLVSHAVDGEKRGKVLERDLSMVEINLSGVRAGQLSAEALDEAILHSAPRHWVHHRRRPAAAKRLAEQVAAKRTERGRQLKYHIEKEVRFAYPLGWTDEASPSVSEAGLAHLVDLDVKCDHWFTVSRAVWQAQALEAHIIEPGRQLAPGGRCIAVRGAWPNERALASKLPAWMIRSDLSCYRPERLVEAGYDRASFGSAEHAVWNYFAALQLRGEAVFWSQEEQAFFIEPKLHGRLHRRVELRRLVMKLLGASEHTDLESGYRRWASTYRVGETTAADLVETGGESYRDLLRRLEAVEMMLPSHSRKAVEDLCGLPLEPIRERNLAAIAADEEARLHKENEAADRRRDSICRLAEQMLEQDASEWLTRRVEPGAVSVVEFASSSDEALHKAKRWLGAAADRRRQEIIIARQTVRLRANLMQAARKAFGDPAMAELFLNSGQPRIGGRRPIDYCDSEDALQLLLTLLPKRR